jgi:hypothetical protein
MNKKQAYQELTFIKKFMEDSQKALIDNGIFIILMSLFALLGVALKMFKDFMGLDIHNLYIYIPLIAVGICFAAVYKSRLYAKSGGRTFASRAIDGTWTAFLISVFILGIIGYTSGGIPPLSVAPVICVLFGFHQYICGLLLNRRLFSATALGWWFSSVCLFLWPGEHSVVWVAVFLILFQLIPGFFLYRNWKKRRHG